jgi:protein SCO1/2
MSTDRSLYSLRIKIALSLLGAIFLCLGIYSFDHYHKDPTIFHGTLLETPRNIPGFALVGTDGQPYTQASLHGQWTLMFFGFTHCGSICPVTMAKLAKMVQELEEKHTHPLPKVVFITLDPEQDSLDRLAHYVHSFKANFFAARGSTQQIDAMTYALGIAYMQASKSQPLEHSGTLMLFNPEGQLAAFFTPPHSIKDLVADYQWLISA